MSSASHADPWHPGGWKLLRRHQRSTAVSGIRKPQPQQAHQGLGGRRNTAQASSQGSWGPLLEKAKQILPSKTEGKHVPFTTESFTSALLLSPSHTPFIQPLSFPAALLGCWSFVPSSQEEGHSFPCMAVCLRPLSSQEGHLHGRVPPSLTLCVFGSSAPLLPLHLEADSFPVGFTQRLSIKETSLGGAGCSLLHVALNTTAQGTGSTSFPF